MLILELQGFIFFGTASRIIEKQSGLIWNIGANPAIRDLRLSTGTGWALIGGGVFREARHTGPGSWVDGDAQRAQPLPNKLSSPSSLPNTTTCPSTSPISIMRWPGPKTASWRAEEVAPDQSERCQERSPISGP